MLRIPVLVGALALVPAFPGAAGALPQYARLLQARYRFKPNCTACHDRDSWELTGFAKAFAKNGRTLAAFATAEAGDPDEDGASSGSELAARSNPSDPRSTPERPGDWTSRLRPLEPPLKHLRALFPDSDRYLLWEGELDAAAASAASKALGRSLRDEDRYPVFFEAFRNGASAGVALYGSSSGDEPCFFLAGYAREGKPRAFRVTGLRMLSCPARLLRSARFLDQFAGKAVKDLASVGAPRPELAPQAAAVVQAVQSGAAALAEAFR